MSANETETLSAPRMARLELPDFVTERSVERAYVRAKQMQDDYMASRGRRYADAWASRGVRAAKARDGKLLRFLEFSVEVLARLNDTQQSRLEQAGLHRQDYTEFSLWKAAMSKADELGRDESCDPGVFRWIYGAAAEAVFGNL
ncbi:MAG: hypothetical protein EXR31_10445 [Betaproteobacteria bacterium]|nr:hypothetical protein [Betaproteobacteria bacterium]